MAHFAKIDQNNRVEMVLVGRDEDDGKELELCQRTGDHYRQTSFNTRGGIHYNAQNIPSEDQSKSFRKNFAKKGSIYNEEIDGFIDAQPFPSWTLNKVTGNWEAPSLPIEISSEEYIIGVRNVWNEELQTWEKKIKNKETGELENYTGGLNSITN